MTTKTDVHREGPNTDEWSWRKFFHGFVSGSRYGKSLALLLQMFVLIFVFSMLALGVKYLFDAFSPKTPPPRPDVVTAETATIDKRTTTVNQTYLPLSNALSNLFGGGRVGSADTD